MNQIVNLQIAGLGIILYSPWAVTGIAAGTDYLSTHYWEGPDVARHVKACTIAGVGTGSPGDFRLHFYTGRLNDAALARAKFKVRLGLEVRDRTICARDLYDLLSWDPSCPVEQTLEAEDGFYRITAYTSPPPSGIFGDGQDISFHFQPFAAAPTLVYEGVPQLC